MSLRRVLALVLILVASAAQSGCFYREREPPASDVTPSTSPPTIVPPTSTPSVTPPPPAVVNQSPPPPLKPGFERIGDSFAVAPDGVRGVQLAIAYASSLDEHLVVYREPARDGVEAAIRFARIETGSAIGVAAGRVSMAAGTFASPSIAWNPRAGESGEYLTAWIEARADASGTLRIQRISAVGERLGSALNLTAPASGDADVVPLGTGFLIAYEEPTSGSFAARAIGVGVHAGNAFVSTPTPLTVVRDGVIDVVAVSVEDGSRAVLIARVQDAAGGRVVASVVEDSFTVSKTEPIAVGDVSAPIELALFGTDRLVVVTREGERTLVRTIVMSTLQVGRAFPFNATARLDAVACIVDACGIALVTDAGRGVSGIVGVTNLTTGIALTAPASFTTTYAPPRDIEVALARAGPDTVLACVAGIAQGGVPACARFARA